ncbi:MAG: DNA repair protein RecO [Actinomycetes bacterium]
MTSRLYRDNAIVLRTYKLGESDRIVIFLTENYGKVRAVAKGIRKTRSKFGGRLEPLSHVAVQFHRGRDLDIVSQVESIDSNAAVFGNLDSMTQASSLLEAVDQLVPDREPVPQMFKMLLGARQTLLTRPSPIVVPAFLWKLLAAEGVRPQLDTCVACGEESGQAGDFVAFDLQQGGVVCRSCRAGFAISPAALQLLRDVLGGRLSEILDQTHQPGRQILDDPVLNELAQLATRAFEHHIERKLRSVSLFERH